MTIGFCYDAPTRCRSGCQPGVRAWRKVTQERIPELGDFGCFNCRSTRTGKNLSLHGEGRATDDATPIKPNGLLDLEFNTRYGDFCVAAAQDLGIQRVIGWGPRFDGSIGPREWDARLGERYWEHYSGPLHKDHNHVEFCWESAHRLTEQQVHDAIDKYWFGMEGEELTPDEKQKVDDTYEAVFVFRTPEGASKPKRYQHLDIIERQNRAILAHLGIEVDAVGIPKT